MKRSPTTQDVSWFLDLHRREQLNLDPPYQRRSVWSPADKRYFIDTILGNYPSPPIFLHKTIDENGEATYHVVDGKQRLQTIIEFVNNKVFIPEDFSDINLQKKHWRDLGSEIKNDFWNYSLNVEMLPNVSDPMIRSIFDRINRNSKRLTRQEMRHAKYDGWLIKTAESEAREKDWTTLGVVTAARTKRMQDVQFISELLAVMLTEKIMGFDQNHLDDLYAHYDDIDELDTFDEDEFLSELSGAKDLLLTLITQDSNLIGSLRIQAHCYSLWGYVHLESKRLPTTLELGSRYNTFMSFVKRVQATDDPDEHAKILMGVEHQQCILDYASNSRGASTDLAQRQKRHDALTTAINEPVNLEDEDR